MYSGSYKYLPKFKITFSSTVSVLNETISSNNDDLPNTLSDAAHQSVTNLIPSLSLVFSVGFGYNNKHNALKIFLIVLDGAFIYFKNSIYFLSNTFNASYAAFNAGIASDNSASHSSLIAFALSTASYTTASSDYIPAFNVSAYIFSF